MSDKPKKSAPLKIDALRPPTSGDLVRGAPRVISLIVLLVVLAFIGVLFFRVMAGFLIPLFLAAVLTVVFKPLHVWLQQRLNGRKQLAALACTAAIGLLVLVPCVLLITKAAVEAGEFAALLRDADKQSRIAGELADRFGPMIGQIEDRVNATFYSNIPEPDQFKAKAFLESVGGDLASAVQSNLVDWGASGLSAAFGFVIGLFIMVFALYYFLADGPTIVEALMRLSPLDDEYERQLLNSFTSVSRAVVLATMLSAAIQGTLAGLGYFFTLDPGSPVFMLTMLTMLMALVPFVGSFSVWVPVALWVFFVQEDFWPGILLGIYGAAIVSQSDNVIQPLVLHGRSNLHPLLALLSVLGGLQLLGPIGILVGPILVAFMQALLEMLRKELDILQAEAAASETPST